MVHTTDAAAEYFFKEGCFILEMWNDAADPAVSIARARVKPGAKTRIHRLLDTTERYVILSGKGTVFVGDLPPAEVAAGSVVFIPPNTPQSIRNDGPDDLTFLAICSPRFQTAHYCEDGD